MAKRNCDSESRLWAAIIKQVTGEVARSFDWDQIAQDAGYKNAKNASDMFGRFKKRMMDEAPAAADGAEKTKPPAKRGTKRATNEAGQDEGGAKLGAKKPKKSEVSVKKEITEEDIGDGFGDSGASQGLEG